MRYIKIIIIICFCASMICGCEDANKEKAKEWRRQAELDALTYITEKYGYTDSIVVDSETVMYSSLFSMQSSDRTYVTLESKGKEYHVMISRDEKESDFLPADDYQKEQIENDFFEVVSEIASVKPQSVHMSYSNCYFSYRYDRSFLLHDKYAGGDTTEEKKAALEKLFGDCVNKGMQTNLGFRLDYIGDGGVDIENEVKTVASELFGLGDFLLCGGVFSTKKDSEQCAKYRLNTTENVTFDEDRLFAMYAPNMDELSYCLVEDGWIAEEGVCEFDTGGIGDIVYWVPKRKVSEYTVSKQGFKYVVEGLDAERMYVYKKKNIFSKSYVNDTKGIGKPALKFNCESSYGKGIMIGETYALYTGIEKDNEEKMQYHPFVIIIRAEPQNTFWFSYF